VKEENGRFELTCHHTSKAELALSTPGVLVTSHWGSSGASRGVRSATENGFLLSSGTIGGRQKTKGSIGNCIYQLLSKAIAASCVSHLGYCSTVQPLLGQMSASALLHPFLQLFSHLVNTTPDTDWICPRFVVPMTLAVWGTAPFILSVPDCQCSSLSGVPASTFFSMPSAHSCNLGNNQIRSPHSSMKHFNAPTLLHQHLQKTNETPQNRAGGVGCLQRAHFHLSCLASYLPDTELLSNSITHTPLTQTVVTWTPCPACEHPFTIWKTIRVSIKGDPLNKLYHILMIKYCTVASGVHYELMWKDIHRIRPCRMGKKMQVVRVICTAWII
jgi:hypothetical protein